MQDTRLPDRFARLAILVAQSKQQARAEDAIARFARRYGLLNRVHRKAGDAESDWPRRPVWSESLSVWRYELRLFHVLWEMERALRRSSRDGAALANLVVWESKPLAVRVKVPADLDEPDVPAELVLDDRHLPLESLEYEQGSLPGPLSSYLRRRLNHKLAGRVDVTVDSRGAPMMQIVPDSLLSAIYLHFSARAAGVAPGGMRTCARPDCNVLFSGRANRVYCSDACGANMRSRRKRDSDRYSNQYSNRGGQQ